MTNYIGDKMTCYHAFVRGVAFECIQFAISTPSLSAFKTAESMLKRASSSDALRHGQFTRLHVNLMCEWHKYNCSL